MKKYIPFYFMFEDMKILKRDITRRDKVKDLRSILGVPEDTEITFIYKNFFLDPDDEDTKEAYLHQIIDYFERSESPDYMSVGGGMFKTDSFIFVQGAHKSTNFTTDKGQTIEYKNIKYDRRGNPTVGGVTDYDVSPRDWDLRDQTMDFNLDDYKKKNRIYMEKYGDYSIMSHGTIKNSFFFVPENITVILNSELGENVGTSVDDTKNGLADSVRTQRRLNELSFSSSTYRDTNHSLIERIYEPGSIIPEHELEFRGWWDPMGSGLIPKEVYEIVDMMFASELEGKLNDYNSKYEEWNPLRDDQRVQTAIERLQNYDIEIEYMTDWDARGEEKKRKGTLWFNIYPSLFEGGTLSSLLYWLSNKVGEKNIKVYCHFCRNLISQSKFEDELKECLNYDKEIFRDTFLQGLSGESDILELSRQGSFSSLEIKKNNILSELERYKRLGIYIKMQERNPGYNIEKLITLNTLPDLKKHIHSHLVLLWKDKLGIKEDIPEIESIKDLLHIKKMNDKFILDDLPVENEINISINNLENYVYPCIIENSQSDCEALETKIIEIIKNIADYYNEKLAGGDINNLKLYRSYLNLVAVMEKTDEISIQGFCHILLFMKLMREMHEHGSLEPEPVSMMVEPEQGDTGVSAGGGRRRKKKRKTKRKKSKKNKRKSKRKSKRRNR